MVLEGPSIEDQSQDQRSPAALAFAQFLKFNSIMQMKNHESVAPGKVRYSTTQETPLPTYIGLMVHAKTRKRELVDRLALLGFSISYDCVLRLSAQMGEGVFQQIHREQMVCPPTMRGGISTTAAVHNIDHNPSSTTPKESFHGTGISLSQHPSSEQGVDLRFGIVIVDGSTTSKTVNFLPSFNPDVPPITTSIKQPVVSPSGVTSLKRGNRKLVEYHWLEDIRQVIEGTSDKMNNLSWAAFHASRQTQQGQVLSHGAVFPLFSDSAHTVAMIRHSINVIRNAVDHLSAGQTPVITLDKPLYAIAKQNQWKWPAE